MNLTIKEKSVNTFFKEAVISSNPWNINADGNIGIKINNNYFPQNLYPEMQKELVVKSNNPYGISGGNDIITFDLNRTSIELGMEVRLLFVYESVYYDSVSCTLKLKSVTLCEKVTQI